MFDEFKVVPHIMENGELKWNRQNAVQEYTAILELEKKLKENNIPCELTPLMDGWLLCYPKFAMGPERIGDVVEHWGSYGREQNLMEAMGFGLPDVVGHLTVEQAFSLFETANKKSMAAAEILGV